MDVIDLDPAWLARSPLPAVDQGDKESRGRILVVGGSLEVPGGPLLAGLAALRAGAGKLQVAIDERIQPHLAVALPEAMVVPLPQDPAKAAAAVLDLARACAAVVAGPGMTDKACAKAIVAALLAEPDGPPLLLDAAALVDLDAGLVRANGQAILTPHAGEMAGLMEVSKEEVLAAPLAFGRRAAERFGAVVAMKGACTYVVAPDGLALRHGDGPFGLATSGSGDVLAGIIGGLLARGASPLTATAWGVFLHAKAGARLTQEVGPLGFLAREILDEIAPALRQAAP